MSKVLIILVLVANGILYSQEKLIQYDKVSITVVPIDNEDLESYRIMHYYDFPSKSLRLALNYKDYDNSDKTIFFNRLTSSKIESILFTDFFIDDKIPCTDDNDVMAVYKFSKTEVSGGYAINRDVTYYLPEGCSKFQGKLESLKNILRKVVANTKN